MALFGSKLLFYLVPMLLLGVGAQHPETTERASIVLSCPNSTPCGWNNVVEVTQSGTHIVSSSNKNITNNECEIVFTKPNEDICQVRLDFLTFDLPPPNENNDCADARFQVTADNLREFQTCGSATGQHLYLHFGELDMVSASLYQLKQGMMATADYDILATFIPCPGTCDDPSEDDAEAAPAGCDQYYTGLSGQIQSFNYFPVSAPVQNQINSQRYSVCIETPSGSNGITWNSCGNDSFFISGSSYSGSAGPLTGNNCTFDYVDIPGSPGGRYCGQDFPPEVTSRAKPFYMYVNFDHQELNPIDTSIRDPVIGCPVGFECVNAFGDVIAPDGPNSPGDVLPCDSAGGIPNGQYCRLPGSLWDKFDWDNVGFCLNYKIIQF